MNLSETINRTVKLAMDDGRATSVRDAIALFSTFTLQFVVQPGFSRSISAQAALLTLINAAPRTFLGGVTVHGDTEEKFTLGPVNGATLSEVATRYSAVVVRQ